MKVYNELKNEIRMTQPTPSSTQSINHNPVPKPLSEQLINYESATASNRFGNITFNQTSEQLDETCLSEISTRMDVKLEQKYPRDNYSIYLFGENLVKYITKLLIKN